MLLLSAWPTKQAQALKILFRVREMLSWNLEQGTDYPDWDFSCFSQFLQANAEIVG